MAGLLGSWFSPLQEEEPSLVTEVETETAQERERRLQLERLEQTLQKSMSGMDDRNSNLNRFQTAATMVIQSKIGVEEVEEFPVESLSKAELPENHQERLSFIQRTRNSLILRDTKQGDSEVLQMLEWLGVHHRDEKTRWEAIGSLNSEIQELNLEILPDKPTDSVDVDVFLDGYEPLVARNDNFPIDRVVAITPPTGPTTTTAIVSTVATTDGNPLLEEFVKMVELEISQLKEQKRGEMVEGIQVEEFLQEEDGEEWAEWDWTWEGVVGEGKDEVATTTMTERRTAAENAAMWLAVSSQVMYKGGGQLSEKLVRPIAKFLYWSGRNVTSVAVSGAVSGMLANYLLVLMAPIAGPFLALLGGYALTTPFVANFILLPFFTVVTNTILMPKLHQLISTGATRGGRKFAAFEKFCGILYGMDTTLRRQTWAERRLEEMLGEKALGEYMDDSLTALDHYAYIRRWHQTWAKQIRTVSAMSMATTFASAMIHGLFNFDNVKEAIAQAALGKAGGGPPPQAFESILPFLNSMFMPKESLLTSVKGRALKPVVLYLASRFMMFDYVDEVIGNSISQGGQAAGKQTQKLGRWIQRTLERTGYMLSPSQQNRMVQHILQADPDWMEKAFSAWTEYMFVNMLGIMKLMAQNNLHTTSSNLYDAGLVDPVQIYQHLDVVLNSSRMKLVDELCKLKVADGEEKMFKGYADALAWVSQNRPDWQDDRTFNVRHELGLVRNQFLENEQAKQVLAQAENLKALEETKRKLQEQAKAEEIQEEEMNQHLQWLREQQVEAETEQRTANREIRTLKRRINIETKRRREIATELKWTERLQSENTKRKAKLEGELNELNGRIAKLKEGFAKKKIEYEAQNDKTTQWQQMQQNVEDEQDRTSARQSELAERMENNIETSDSLKDELRRLNEEANRLRDRDPGLDSLVGRRRTLGELQDLKRVLEERGELLERRASLERLVGVVGRLEGVSQGLVNIQKNLQEDRKTMIKNRTREEKQAKLIHYYDQQRKRSEAKQEALFQQMADRLAKGRELQKRADEKANELIMVKLDREKNNKEIVRLNEAAISKQTENIELLTKVTGKVTELEGRVASLQAKANEEENNYRELVERHTKERQVLLDEKVRLEISIASVESEVAERKKVLQEGGLEYYSKREEYEIELAEGRERLAKFEKQRDSILKKKRESEEFIEELQSSVEVQRLEVDGLEDEVSRTAEKKQKLSDELQIIADQLTDIQERWDPTEMKPDQLEWLFVQSEKMELERRDLELQQSEMERKVEEARVALQLLRAQHQQSEDSHRLSMMHLEQQIDNVQSSMDKENAWIVESEEMLEQVTSVQETWNENYKDGLELASNQAVGYLMIINHMDLNLNSIRTSLNLALANVGEESLDSLQTRGMSLSNEILAKVLSSYPALEADIQSLEAYETELGVMQKNLQDLSSTLAASAALGGEGLDLQTQWLQGQVKRNMETVYGLLSTAQGEVQGLLPGGQALRSTVKGTNEQVATGLKEALLELEVVAELGKVAFNEAKRLAEEIGKMDDKSLVGEEGQGVMDELDRAILKTDMYNDMTLRGVEITTILIDDAVENDVLADLLLIHGMAKAVESVSGVDPQQILRKRAVLGARANALAADRLQGRVFRPVGEEEDEAVVVGRKGELEVVREFEARSTEEKARVVGEMLDDNRFAMGANAFDVLRQSAVGIRFDNLPGELLGAGLALGRAAAAASSKPDLPVETTTAAPAPAAPPPGVDLLEKSKRYDSWTGGYKTVFRKTYLEGGSEALAAQARASTLVNQMMTEISQEMASKIPHFATSSAWSQREYAGIAGSIWNSVVSSGELLGDLERGETGLATWGKQVDAAAEIALAAGVNMVAPGFGPLAVAGHKMVDTGLQMAQPVRLAAKMNAMWGHMTGDRAYKSEMFTKVFDKLPSTLKVSKLAEKLGTGFRPGQLVHIESDPKFQYIIKRTDAETNKAWVKKVEAKGVPYDVREIEVAFDDLQISFATRAGEVNLEDLAADFLHDVLIANPDEPVNALLDKVVGQLVLGKNAGLLWWDSKIKSLSEYLVGTDLSVSDKKLFQKWHRDTTDLIFTTLLMPYLDDALPRSELEERSKTDDLQVARIWLERADSDALRRFGFMPDEFPEEWHRSEESGEWENLDDVGTEDWMRDNFPEWKSRPPQDEPLGAQQQKAKDERTWELLQQHRDEMLQSRQWQKARRLESREMTGRQMLNNIRRNHLDRLYPSSTFSTTEVRQSPEEVLQRLRTWTTHMNLAREKLQMETTTVETVFETSGALVWKAFPKPAGAESGAEEEMLAKEQETEWNRDSDRLQRNALNAQKSKDDISTTLRSLNDLVDMRLVATQSKTFLRQILAQVIPKAEKAGWTFGNDFYEEFAKNHPELKDHPDLETLAYLDIFKNEKYVNVPWRKAWRKTVAEWKKDEEIVEGEEERTTTRMPWLLEHNENQLMKELVELVHATSGTDHLARSLAPGGEGHLKMLSQLDGIGMGMEQRLARQAEYETSLVDPNRFRNEMQDLIRSYLDGDDDPSSLSSLQMQGIGLGMESQMAESIRKAEEDPRGASMTTEELVVAISEVMEADRMPSDVEGMETKKYFTTDQYSELIQGMGMIAKTLGDELRQFSQTRQTLLDAHDDIDSLTALQGNLEETVGNSKNSIASFQLQLEELQNEFELYRRLGLSPTEMDVKISKAEELLQTHLNSLQQIERTDLPEKQELAIEARAAAARVEEATEKFRREWQKWTLLEETTTEDLERAKQIIEKNSEELENSSQVLNEMTDTLSRHLLEWETTSGSLEKDLEELEVKVGKATRRLNSLLDSKGQQDIVRDLETQLQRLKIDEMAEREKLFELDRIGERTLSTEAKERAEAEVLADKQRLQAVVDELNQIEERISPGESSYSLLSNAWGYLSSFVMGRQTESARALKLLDWQKKRLNDLEKSLEDYRTENEAMDAKLKEEELLLGKMKENTRKWEDLTADDMDVAKINRLASSSEYMLDQKKRLEDRAIRRRQASSDEKGDLEIVELERIQKVVENAQRWILTAKRSAEEAVADTGKTALEFKTAELAGRDELIKQLRSSQSELLMLLTEKQLDLRQLGQFVDELGTPLPVDTTEQAELERQKAELEATLRDLKQEYDSLGEDFKRVAGEFEDVKIQRKQNSKDVEGLQSSIAGVRQNIEESGEEMEEVNRRWGELSAMLGNVVILREGDERQQGIAAESLVDIHDQLQELHLETLELSHQLRQADVEAGFFEEQHARQSESLDELDAELNRIRETTDSFISRSNAAAAKSLWFMHEQVDVVRKYREKLGTKIGEGKKALRETFAEQTKQDMEYVRRLEEISVKMHQTAQALSQVVLAKPLMVMLGTLGTALRAAAFAVHSISAVISAVDVLTSLDNIILFGNHLLRSRLVQGKPILSTKTLTGDVYTSVLLALSTAELVLSINSVATNGRYAVDYMKSLHDRERRRGARDALEETKRKIAELMQIARQFQQLGPRASFRYILDTLGSLGMETALLGVALVPRSPTDVIWMISKMMQALQLVMIWSTRHVGILGTDINLYRVLPMLWAALMGTQQAISTVFTASAWFGYKTAQLMKLTSHYVWKLGTQLSLHSDDADGQGGGAASNRYESDSPDVLRSTSINPFTISPYSEGHSSSVESLFDKGSKGGLFHSAPRLFEGASSSAISSTTTTSTNPSRSQVGIVLIRLADELWNHFHLAEQEFGKKLFSSSSSSSNLATSATSLQATTQNMQNHFEQRDFPAAYQTSCLARVHSKQHLHEVFVGQQTLARRFAPDH